MSNMVIEEGIRFLIGDHGKVVIPRIGVLVGRYASAQIDPLEGKITPPSLGIQFQNNTDSSAAMLVDYIAGKLNCSYQDAENKLNSFSENLRKRLSENGTCQLEGVGQLSIGAQGEIKFQQASADKIFQSFGLPVLNFKPISRIENRLLALDLREAPRNQKENMLSRISSLLFAKEFMPITIGLAAFVVFLGLFFLVPQPEINFAKELSDKKAKPERINTKPSHEPRVELATSTLTPEELKAEEAKLASEVDAVVGGNDVTSNSTPSSPAKSSDLQQSIIIVGVYSQIEGIRMRQAQIERLGHTFYEQQEGNVTRVGLIVHHVDQNELVKILRTVQKEIESRAWIL